MAASDDLTGSGGQGGDWDLEVQSGLIETDLAVSGRFQSSWSGTLTLATFQQDVSSYTGTQDTYLDESNADSIDAGGSTSINVDLDVTGGLEAQGLIRFDNLFGSGPGQIPYGSTINSASLTIEVTGASSIDANIRLHKMLVNWDQSSSTWNSMSTGGGGLQSGSEYIATATSTLPAPDTMGPKDFAGLAADLQSWSDGGSNYGWAILTDTDNGWDFESSENVATGIRPELTVDYTLPQNVLWISTDADGTAADGLPGGWKEGHVLEFGGPDLSLGVPTDGDFSTVIDFDSFVTAGSGTVDTGALHFVNRNLTIGSGADRVDLQVGDVLVSFNQDETILAAYYETGVDTLVGQKDLLVFRPDSPGVYGSGTFYMLLNGIPDTADNPISNLNAISLVEQDTRVGLTDLAAGTFIFAEQAGVAPNNIYHFTPTVAGKAAADGTTITLVDGADINIGAGKNVRGLELIESATTVGGISLNAGDILVTLSTDDPDAGDNNLDTATQDIFVLSVTAAEPDTGTTAATATMLLNGDQVNLDGTERIYAVALTPGNLRTEAQDDRVGLSFDGVDDYVVVADDTSLVMADNLTMEAWINHSGSGAGSQIIINKEGEYEIGITADTGEIKWAIADSVPAWGWRNTGYFVEPGEWAHIAVTYDGVASEAKTYINGMLIDTFSRSGPIGDVYDAYDELRIGGRENATDQRFDGLIDEVRIWNTTRTEAEIKSNFDALLAGNETGLVGNWRFDEGEGNTAFDQSASANHGTFGGVDAPAAEPVWSGYLTNQDTVLDTTALAIDGVLDNDRDAVGETLTATNLDTSGTLGLVTLNADGSFTYDPNGQFENLGAGEHAIDSFTYTANDGTGDSNTATVTITVSGFNDAPTAANKTVTTDEDTTYTFGAADFNFSDIDGDTLESIKVTSLESQGSLQLNGSDVILNQVITKTDIDLGLLKFVPVADQNGTGYDAFEFKVSDGATSGTVGTLLESFAVPEANSMSGLAFDGTNFWLNGQNSNTVYQLDSAGNLLSSFSGPGTSPTGLTFDGTNLWLVDRDMNMIYELDTAGNLLSSFATPGTDSRGLTFDGTDLWLIEGNGSLIYQLTTSGAVVSNIPWPDDYLRGITWDGTNLWVADQNDQLIHEVSTTGTHLSSIAAPATAPAGITFDGNDFWHLDSDTDTVYQLAGPNSTVYSAAYTMSVDVNPINDAPVLNTAFSPALTSITEDTVNPVGDTIAALVVDGSVTDTDGSPLEAIAITSTDNGYGTWEYSVNGGANWNLVGTVSPSSALLLESTDLLRYVPDGQHGETQQFSYRAWDQSGVTAGLHGTKVSTLSTGGSTPFSSALETASITVTAVNDAPVAVNDAYTVDEDGTLNSGADWFDNDWSYRKTLSFDNLDQSEDLANFPVLVKLDATRIDYTKTKDAGEDLRFVDGDGNLLAHQVEKWDEFGTSYVWVKVAQVDGASTTDFIHMYYGNTAATAAEGQVWSENYQAVYHLNEAAGALSDSTANSFDGTNNGSTDGAGFIDNGQVFNGSNQWIDLGSQAFLNNTPSATLSAWINTDTVSGSGRHRLGFGRYQRGCISAGIPRCDKPGWR